MDSQRASRLDALADRDESYEPYIEEHGFGDVCERLDTVAGLLWIIVGLLVFLLIFQFR